jgi:BASS family bile acid:Na+ symporter
MEESFLLSVVLPLALGIIMLGLGLSLTTADFRRVLEVPGGVAVGLAVQGLLLPLVCVGICHLFALPPWYAVGFVLLAASPGGPTANLYSHLAGGDVALNLTLTAINSVLSIVTLPVITGLGVRHFMGVDADIPLQLGKVVQVMTVVLAPVALGMAIRRRAPDAAVRMERPVKLVSVAFLAAIIIAAVLQERARLGEMLIEIGLPALLFNLASLGAGFAVPRLLNLSARQSAAIALEIGIHNGMLAMTVAHHVLGDGRMAIPAAIYSLIMYGTSSLFAAWARARIQSDTA